VPVTLKALRKKDFADCPKTLGEHLRKRRKQLALVQREAAERLGIDVFTYLNWETDKTKPVDAQFAPVVTFLGYDPSRPPTTLLERLTAQRRALGATLDQVAQYLGWDPFTLNRYVRGIWPMSPERAAALEAFLVADPASLTPVLAFARRRRRRPVYRRESAPSFGS